MKQITAAWYLLHFLLPTVNAGTKEVHTKKIKIPVNGKISLILIFSVHFLWHFQQNLKVFQLPLVAKYLSTEGTLASSLSKKTTDVDNRKV